MLINKGYTPGDVITLKLLNGDEVVAKLAEQTTMSWIVEKPCTIIPSPQGMGLVQSLISADINKAVEIKFEHVLMHAPAMQVMVDYYIQTTTGIQTVSKGSVIV